MSQPSVSSFHPSAPSVFISSTVYDLRDLRSALVHVLRSQGVLAYASEATEFAIHGDRSAVDECFNRIRTSNYYVLIIGGRKGGILEDGQSITRHEYKVAAESFMATGKPVLWMFVRKEILLALAGGDEVRSWAGIDDPGHLAEFIDEVRHPADSRIPNWLSEFNEVSEVIDKVMGNLNLGRNLWESFVRHAIISELTANLSLVTSRLGTTAVPRHRTMQSVRGNHADMGPDALSGNLDIGDQDRKRLVLALFPGYPVARLSNDALMQAINGGVFLTIDSATGKLSETVMHKELVQAMNSVELLREFESSFGENMTRLTADLLASSDDAHVPSKWTVRRYDLMIAFRFYDWMDDLFNGHLAICDALIHGQPEPATYQRSPVTPIGDNESARILAERVSAPEIEHLITNNIFPFGSRVMPESWASTEHDRIQKVAKVIRRGFNAINPEIEISPDMLEEMAREWLRNNAPGPEEGLEDLSGHFKS